MLTKFDLATRLYTMVPGVKSSYWGYMPCATAPPVRGLMLWVAGYGNYNAQKQFAMYALDLAHPEHGGFGASLPGIKPRGNGRR